MLSLFSKHVVYNDNFEIHILQYYLNKWKLVPIMYDICMNKLLYFILFYSKMHLKLLLSPTSEGKKLPRLKISFSTILNYTQSSAP